MDGDSGLNLMYLDTFEGLVLAQEQLKNSPHTFYGVVLDKQPIPLGKINLSVTFGNASNYHTKMLTFEVVDFSGPYHIILGWLCYVKVMTIPSYAYLKIKISGPTDVITVESKARRVLDCEQNSIELAAATITTIAAEIKEFCLSTPPSLANPSMPSTSGTFKAAEDTKAI
jgi:hypothetical protein